MNINIVGQGGSGKTTLAKSLVAFESTFYKRLIAYTNRPPRPGEIDGVDYFFVDKNFSLEEENGFVMQRRRPEGTYAVKLSDLQDLGSKGCLITTFPPKGILSLEKFGLRVLTFYLEADAALREARMTQRGDKKELIKKRLLADKTESTLESTRKILGIDGDVYVLDAYYPTFELVKLINNLILL